MVTLKRNLRVQMSTVFRHLQGCQVKTSEAYSLWTQSGDLRPKVYRENEIQNFKTECLKIGQIFTIGGDLPIANTHLIIS